MMKWEILLMEIMMAATKNEIEMLKWWTPQKMLCNDLHFHWFSV